jgi:hypothetical protein
MLVLTASEPPLELDACRACNAAWFDEPTYQSLPQLTLETTNSIPLQSTEIVAMMRLKELKEREQAEQEQPRKKKPRRRLLGPRDGAPGA